MKKILIAEDEEMLRSAYKQILSHEGFEIIEAVNGKVALQRLADSPPDLVLLDILMPEMDGLEFLKRADIKNKFPKTKIIAFSNLSDQHKLKTMMNLGVTENVLKSSLSPKQLAETVRKILA